MNDVKLLSILTLSAVTVLGGGCAVTRNPVGPAVDAPSQPAPEPDVDVVEAPVVAPVEPAPPVNPCDGVPGTYNPETDLCETFPTTVPAPTTTYALSQDCLNDDLGVYNPETDLCELP